MCSSVQVAWATSGRSSSSHSSSILTVPNDILMAISCQDVVLLVLLDLSATFDKVTLCLAITSQLKLWNKRDSVRVHDLRLNLPNRLQRVSLKSNCSDAFPLKQSFPQGSCLGPVLLSLYASKLFEVVKRHLLSVHAYADDTQLYLALSLIVP